MATVRFSMVEVASRAFGVEAWVRGMSEAFGRHSAAKASRFERQREAFCKREIKKLQSEAGSLLEWTANHLMQAGKYQSALIDQVKHAFTVYSPEEVDKLAVETNAAIERLSAQVAVIRTDMDKMEKACRAADELNDERCVIQAYYRTVTPCMESIRRNARKLAAIMA